MVGIRHLWRKRAWQAILLMALFLLLALTASAEGDVIPPEGTVYVVQPGDSLESIAARYGTTVSALIEANNLARPDLIFYYEELLIVPADYAPGGYAPVGYEPDGVEAAAPQTWPTCNWNCRAGDVNVTAFWFGQEDGSPLEICTPGEPAEAWVWAVIENTHNASRYQLTQLGDLYVGGVQVDTLEECTRDSIGSKETITTTVASINWVCGPTVELRNPVLIWNAGQAATCPERKRATTGSPASATPARTSS